MLFNYILLMIGVLMIILKKIQFLILNLITFCLITFLNISNVIGSSFTLELSINEAFKNSLELKSQKYKLEATKHSLQEAYSSKD